MNLEKLKLVLEGQPKFRYKQVYQAIYTDLIGDWMENSTLPLSLREELNQECPLDIEAELFGSTKSETQKALLTLSDGAQVETVLMRHEDERCTVCVSSQVGCPLGCAFCATGKLGFKRNLTVDEIISQVLFFARLLKKEKDRVSNVVFMGMGEPFLNYDNVMKAIKILNDKDTFNIGARHISISTSGVIDGINKFMKEDMQINLAISLHAPNDELRSELMPINRKYSLPKLMEAVSKYVALRSRQVMFEYLLIDGVNDKDEHAQELAALMKNPLFMVNLIRYNPTGTFEPSSPATIKRFKNLLLREGIKVTQRYSFGQDIEAACGQLAAKNRNKKD